jgi:putative flippase GtrA
MRLSGIFRKFAKYSGVAAGSVAIDWTVFMTLSLLGGTYLFCQALSRIAGGVFSFIANRYWSFSSNRSKHITVQGRRFVLLYAFSYALSLCSMYFFVDMVHLPVYWSKLSSDALCFVINFIAMHSYVYSQREGLVSSANNVIGSILRKSLKTDD